MAKKDSAAFQRCINPACAATFDIHEALTACPECGNLLDIAYDWEAIEVPKRLSDFERRWARRTDPLDFSGVWRFRELLSFAPEEALVTIGEGQTLLYHNETLARQIGLSGGNLHLQYEGLNPSGSFKDNGMAAAFTHARMAGARRAACASTGNTSASMAMYAAAVGMQAVIFIGSGKIAYGKLAQALDSGGLTLQIRGDFDDAMRLVQQAAPRAGLYVVNSVNPFRLEGQKTIMYRVLEALSWEVPDWIVVPGGNLGNSSAFGKAFIELHELGLIDRMPRIAVINSTGAHTLHTLVGDKGLSWGAGSVDDEAIAKYYGYLDAGGLRAHTVATAIEINRPVNLKKCLRALDAADGVVREVPDEDILDMKALVARSGPGCEPASAASVAGARLLVEEGVIGKSDRVVCIITGHVLKDPDVPVKYNSLTGEALVDALGLFSREAPKYQNLPVEIDADLEQIVKVLEGGA
ncbi:MAG: threonine synthase [Planctomycetes bacterium]|nr:threonine synthase [Planctomycetota bacterium]